MSRTPNDDRSDSLLLSTVLYVCCPYLPACRDGRPGGRGYSTRRRVKPWSVVGLIATFVLLFGFQAGTLMEHPLVIAMIAVPLVIQSYGIFLVAAIGARWLKLPHDIAAPLPVARPTSSNWRWQ